MGQLSHYHKQAIDRHEAVVVTQEKLCDFCDIFHQQRTVAVVNGRTISGPWANMCQEHFDSDGVGLGLGRGQRLIVQEYKPSGFIEEPPTACCGATHKGSVNSPTGLCCRACYKAINPDGSLA